MKKFNEFAKEQETGYSQDGGIIKIQMWKKDICEIWFYKIYSQQLLSAVSCYRCPASRWINELNLNAAREDKSGDKYLEPVTEVL